MSTSVLLGGYINSTVVERVKNEVSKCIKNNKEIELVVDSEGGNVIPTLELIDRLQEVESHIRKIKIYKALSCAALLVACIQAPRIVCNATGEVFAFHGGSITLGAEDIDFATGMVNPHIMRSFREYAKKLDAVFEGLGLKKNNPKMAQFYASGWLYLTVSELRTYNIIHDTF